MKVKISVVMNRMGHLEIDPVDEEICGQARWCLRHWGHNLRAQDATIYLQSESEIEEFWERVNARKRKDVERGWSERVMIGEEEFCALVGWDFHIGWEEK